MKSKVVAIAFTLLLSVVSIATPVQSATTYSVKQSTLSAFTGSSTSLSAQQKAQIEKLVRENGSAEKFICTGIRLASQPTSVNLEVRKRAKAACDHAKLLNPGLSTFYQNKPTNAPSYAGKVLLTIKSPKGSSTAADRTEGNQSGYMTEGPGVWLNSTAKIPGGKCQVEGERYFSASRTPLECRRVSLATLRWVGDAALEILSSTKTPANAKAGTTCYRPGERISNGAGVIECRYVAGRALKFVQLIGGNDAPLSATGLTSVEECKMQDQRTKLGGGGSTAFPMKHNRIKSSGVVRIGIVPIDFPDAKAPGKPMDFLAEHLEILNKRNEDLFGNRIKYEFEVPDAWLRMPRTAEHYNQDHATVQPDGSRKADGNKTLLTADEQLTEIYTEAEKVLEIEKMDYFFLFSNPYAADVQFGPGYINTIKTATRTYPNVSSYPVGYFSFNGNFTRNGDPLFSFLSHEIQHAHGMVQHAPGNGTQWFTGTPSTWESWVAGWRPDSEFACVDATKPNNAEISLSSMDLPSSGYKAIVVKVSATEVLVVESRRDGLYNPAFHPGFAGISVYNVSATKAGDRWDGNAAKEKDYYAYFLRNDRGTYPKLVPGPNLGDLNIVGYEGDSFTYRGIKITLKKSASYDTVAIATSAGATPTSKEDLENAILWSMDAREPEGLSHCLCCGCQVPLSN